MKTDSATASDLTTRFAAAVVMIALALVAIYIGGWLFRLLVVATSALMLLEWGDMQRLSRRWSYVGALLLGGGLLVVPEMLFPVDEMDEVISAESFGPAWQGFAAIALGALLFGAITRRLSALGGFLYVGVPAFALIVLDWAWLGLVLWVMVVTWSTDIFAFFAGRSLGGPKLAPRISPAKTWSGLGGGVIGAAVCGALTADWLSLGAPFLYIGGPMAILAQAGDLYESWLKRRAGVKDSGSMLPGHGGVLDRVDGLVPVVVVTLALLMAGLWTG